MSKQRHHRPEVFNWIGTSLLSLVLVFGLIASPLMVVCIPWNSNPRLEFIGQDPCHHANAHPSPGNGSPATLGAYDPENPCLDIILDNFGVAQTNLELQSPRQTCIEQLGQNIAAAPRSLHFVESGRFFKLARTPVSAASADSCLTVALRI